MELFERRKYYFCRYCGTFHFIESAETDGVQVLERSGATPCAVCTAPLAKALLDNVHVIQYCETCRGVLLPRSAFVDVINTRRAFATGAPVPPAPLDDRELQRRVACPLCRRQMDVHPYFGPGNIVIDSCTGCDAVWLDFGELRQVTDAPGKDRGKRFEIVSPPEPPPMPGRRAPSIGHGSGPLLDLFEDLLS